ncbi:hypothetical protein JAAARDRAFT_130475, partial [Jaapia argillacea MUCL 33604]
ISTGCQSTLTALVSSPESACLNAGGLIPIALANSTTSLITPINNWLTGLCSQPACSNQTLSDIVTNVTQGCSAELTAAGLQTSSASALITEIEQVYPTVRQIFCLKDTTDSNTLCITQTLNNLQSVIGPITMSNLEVLIPQITSGSSNVTFPNNVTCTNCIKESYNIIAQNIPSSAGSFQSPLASQCGTSFTNGATPSGIVDTASSASASASSTGKSGSMATFSTGGFVGFAASSMMVVLSAFMILA